MEDLKPIIAKNLTELRLNAKMTQSDLAEQLNYSDKAISKWERAESMPDIAVLKAIADLFGVPLDYLVRQEHTETPVPAESEPFRDRQRIRRIITFLSILLGWSVATLVYVVFDVAWPDLKLHWITFLYAVPVSMIVWLVFNSIWFNRRRNYLIISLLMWSTLACVAITLIALHITAWQFFLLGIPGQVIILAWSGLGKKTK